MKFKVEPKVKATEKEAKVLRAIENSEFSDEGNGLCGYLWEDEFDMKIYRGVLASLVKKGVIGVDDMEQDGEINTWVWIKNDFVMYIEEQGAYMFDPYKIIFPLEDSLNL